MRTIFAITFFAICTCLNAQPPDPKLAIKPINFLIGNWDVEVEARLSMNGPWETSKGKSTIRITLDSTLIEEEFTGSREGKPFLSKSLFAYNNATSKFQRVFIDAPHGTLIDFEGVARRDSLVFEKLWRYANGNTVKLGVAYRRLSADSFTLTSMRMPQGAGSWDVNGRMRYTRVK